MGSTSYSTGYYERLKEDSAASAREVVPIVMRLFAPRTIVDVGCGSGTWTKVYAEQGAEVLGIDGAEVRLEQLEFDSSRFERRDLSRPLALDRRFDIANCLEVAEHLPSARAAGFVADLAKLSDVVIFSAAVPGQGGTHHVNEQWQSYWQRLFEAEGFTSLDCLRPQLWDNNRVAWWYVQNLFVYLRPGRLKDFPGATDAARPWPVDLVHPRAYLKAALPREMSPRMLKEVLKALPHFPAKVLEHLRR